MVSPHTEIPRRPCKHGTRRLMEGLMLAHARTRGDAFAGARFHPATETYRLRSSLRWLTVRPIVIAQSLRCDSSHLAIVCRRALRPAPV